MTNQDMCLAAMGFGAIGAAALYSSSQRAARPFGDAAVCASARHATVVSARAATNEGEALATWDAVFDDPTTEDFAAQFGQVRVPGSLTDPSTRRNLEAVRPRLHLDAVHSKQVGPVVAIAGRDATAVHKPPVSGGMWFGATDAYADAAEGLGDEA